MADDKSGREKKARDADRRQRRRAIAEELERGDEPEPPVDTDELAAIESELESLDFPATGSEIVAAIGDSEVDASTGSYTIEELVPETDIETFDSPAAVRVRIQRPTVARAMKQIAEASKSLPQRDRFGSQRDAYAKTFRELKAIDADDDDEGIQAVSDWILERIHEDGDLPSSRDVRRQAAKICRANGYEIRDNDWLGI